MVPMNKVTTAQLETEEFVSALKAAAEPTRLRILVLLAAEELNVKDLTQILGQSQPRISRHLKLLAESGLIERFREGSWVYFHVSDRTKGGRLARNLLNVIDPTDSVIRRDRERAESLKRDREEAAQDYFRAHAANWDLIRTLYVSDDDVEAAILNALDHRQMELFVDVGTGTGRMLELFSDRYERGLGLDVNQSMLAYARSRLKQSGLGNAEVRHGDLYNLSLADRSADAIIMHQVLHFLAEPAHAIREASRALKEDGRLLIVDFAPHDLEELREHHAHERLGFSTPQVTQWLKEAGLTPIETRDLRPKENDATQKLTVTLWLAHRSTQRAQTQRTNEKPKLARIR